MSVSITVRGRTEINPELRGYTGGIFEWEVLGTCRVLSRGYMSFQRAKEVVMKNQPHNPSRPRGETGRFFDAVAFEMAKLGFDSRDLRLYTAVGSTLDKYHKVDGFFTFQGVTVTLDTTLDPFKKTAKADVIVYGEDAVNGYRDASEAIAMRFCLHRRDMTKLGQ